VNTVSVVYLAMVIVAFVVFGVSLFSVHLYVNAKGAAKRIKAAAPVRKSEDASGYRRAA
jgi:hypothetical protein